MAEEGRDYNMDVRKIKEGITCNFDDKRGACNIGVRKCQGRENLLLRRK